MFLGEAEAAFGVWPAAVCRWREGLFCGRTGRAVCLAQVGVGVGPGADPCGPAGGQAGAGTVGTGQLAIRRSTSGRCFGGQASRLRRPRTGPANRYERPCPGSFPDMGVACCARLLATRARDERRPQPAGPPLDARPGTRRLQPRRCEPRRPLVACPHRTQRQLGAPPPAPASPSGPSPGFQAKGNPRPASDHRQRPPATRKTAPRGRSARRLPDASSERQRPPDSQGRRQNP